MSEIWRTVSMEGKRKDGKGHVVLTTVEYYNRMWIDMRIHNMHRNDGEKTHTRHGFRVSIEQAEEMLTALNMAINKAKEEREINERSEAKDETKT